MSRLEKDGRVVALADGWQGKKLNSPNDLTIDGKGRMPAMEIMVQTSTVSGYIEDAKKTGNIKDIIEAGRTQYGMQSFDQHLTELYRNGDIALETAVQASSSPADFQRSLQFD